MYKTRMNSYYPNVIQSIKEFKSIVDGEYPEFDLLAESKARITEDAYLLTMGEERVAQWEKILGIRPIEGSSVSDRRETVIARIRGQGKLNTFSINAIVNAFTGGTAVSYIENSALHVKITPPPNNKQFKFDNVKRELAKKVPAHLGLEVVRNYATWGEVKDNFDSWDAVNQLTSWEDLFYYVVPRNNNDIITPT